MSTSDMECKGDPVDSKVDLELGVPEVECQAAQATYTSILDRLNAPTKSDLAQKRRIERPKTSASQTKKCKSTLSNQTDQKNVTSVKRVKEFPNECLNVRNSKLLSGAQPAFLQWSGQSKC